MNTVIILFLLYIVVYRIDWGKFIRYSRYERLCKKYGSTPLHKIPYKHRIVSICRRKVKEDGMALQYVPEEHKDLSICQVAVERNLNAIQYVPDEFVSKCKKFS